MSTKMFPFLCVTSKLYIRKIMMYRELPVEPLVGQIDISLVLRDIILLNIKNSPYYKGSDLWDTLPRVIIESDTLYEFKKLLRKEYTAYVEL